MFDGTIIDVLELRNVKTKDGVKTQVRIIWVLGNSDGSYALDTEGNPFRVIFHADATMRETSRLYHAVKSVLGTRPPVPYETEDLVGRSKVLIVIREESAGKLYDNVKNILPLGSGVVGPRVPPGYVRAKDRQRAIAAVEDRP